MNISGLFPVFVLLFAPNSYAGSLKEKQLRWGFSSYPEDVVMVEGTTALLSVTVERSGSLENSDWKFCTWTRESDGSSCRFTYLCQGILCDIGSGDWHINKDCDPSLSDIQYVGEDPNFHNRECGIQIPHLGLDDNSLWTVQLEECKKIGCGVSDGSDHTIKHSSRITLLQEPQEMYLTSPTLPSGGQVHAGTVHQVTCEVIGVRPIPSMTWKLGGVIYPGLVLDQTVTPQEDQSFTVTQMVELGVLFSMDLQTFSCSADIFNTTGQHDLLATKEVGIKLHVQ